MAKLGIKLSEEHKKKIGDVLRGKKIPPLSAEHRNRLSMANKGKHNSPDTQFKKGDKGHLGYKHTEETRKKLSIAFKGRLPWNKGKKWPEKSGENHWNWKGGITSINMQVRTSLEYKLWRTAVFERDNYTCIWCGQWGGKLNADHIKPFSQYPELRFAIDNGRTLCIDCHKTTDTYGNEKRNKYGRFIQ